MPAGPDAGSPDELQADLDPVPGQLVLDQTRLAGPVHWRALYAGLAVVVAAGLVILSLDAGLPAHAWNSTTVVLLLLHFPVRWSRPGTDGRDRPGHPGAATLVA